jgi:Lambda phage tail tape-measure protein (Tape_meas_lam_C)
MADTAALVVALSAQLTKFEKDMKGAVDIASKRTKEIEGTFEKMNKTIAGQLGTLAGQAGGGPFGGIAGGLARLGPVGLTAAAGLGAITVAFLSLNAQVQAFVRQADQLRNAADTTGLTISQLKQLSLIGLEVGVSAEQSEAAIGKMTVAVDQLREGAGPLWDLLRKINPTLVGQVTNAENSAQAIDILAQAYNGLGSEFEKNAFLRAIFGRGGLPFGRVLTEIGKIHGGLQSIADVEFDKTVTEIDQLADTLAKIRQRTTDLWGTAFGSDILNAQIAIETKLSQISARLTEIYTKSRTQGTLSVIADVLAGRRPGISRETVQREGRQQLQQKREQTLREEFEAATFEQRFGAAGTAPLPTARPKGAPLTTEQELKILQERAGLLGDLIGKEEAYRDLKLKLDEAVKKEVITQEEANKKLTELTQTQSAATLALKERLGVASEDELLAARMIPIQQAVLKGTIDSTQALQAETIARREAKEAAEQQLIRLSQLPEVMRQGIDAMDKFKQASQVLTSFASNFESAMGDIATGSKTAAEAFKSLADSIIRDLIRMTIRLTVTGPLLRSIGGAFSFGGIGTPGAGDFGNPFGRQHGGPVRAGSPYVVGEHGPELFVPGQSGRIVPNQPTSRGGTMGGTAITVNNYASKDTETRQSSQQGPSGERIVIDIVKKAQARGDFDDVNRGRFALRTAKVR